MNLTVETEREEDGRWIAEVTDLPGILACGVTHERAVVNSLRLLPRGLEIIDSINYLY